MELAVTCFTLAAFLGLWSESLPDLRHALSPKLHSLNWLSSPQVMTFCSDSIISRPHTSPSKWDCIRIFSAGDSAVRASLNSRIEPLRRPTRRLPLKRSIDLGKEAERSMNLSSLKFPFFASIIAILLSFPPLMILPPTASIAVI